VRRARRFFLVLNRIPRTMPPLATMLDDIGNPSPAALARAFRVSVKTARRWIVAGEAPFAVMAAIFWVTRWGHSSVDAEASNAATMHAAHAAELRRELKITRAQVERLAAHLAHLDTAANGAFYELGAPSFARQSSGSARRIIQAATVTAS
jgi:hypothetical protein